MTLDQSDKESLTLHKIERSMQAENEVSSHIANGFLATAVNRLYYSMFYLISALALKHSFDTSKHQQLIRWFNRIFVKEGIVDRSSAGILRSLYDLRTKGDYDDYVEFTTGMVQSLAKEVHEFNTMIRAILQEQLD